MTSASYSALRRVFVAVLFLPGALAACSCAEYFDTPQAFKRSDLVFRGRVTAITSVEIPQRSWFGVSGNDSMVFSDLKWQTVATFRVLERWKGYANLEEFSVIAGATPEHQSIEDCDAHFELDKEYLVFAVGEFLVADSCSPTGPISEAAEDIAVLNRLASRKRKRG